MIRLQSKDVLDKLNFKDPAVWAATWFGCGLIKPAPGTWGTVGTVPFALALIYFGGLTALLTALVLIIPIGFWAAEKFDRMTGDKDSSMIVIDEAAGFLIAVIPAALSPILIIAAFLLFRFFDIVKPWPVGWCDQKLKGAAGVMMDDIAAGIYAALCVGALNYAGLG